MNIRECPLCGNELTSVETHYNEISGVCRCGLEFRIKGDDPIGTWNNRPVEDELKRMLNEELSKEPLDLPQRWPAKDYEITCKEVKPGDMFLIPSSGKPITTQDLQTMI